MVICRAYAHILMPIQQADAAQKKKSGAINLPNCSFFKTLKRRGRMAVWKTPPSLGGGTPKILGGGVLHRSQNPDPISDQNILFFRPLFRPDPKN